jgi:uncharacterized membrane protein YhaH (DUF805 family)
MDLMFQPYRRYFDFNGRARRSEYWLFFLFYMIVVMVAAGVGAVGRDAHPGTPQYVAGAVLVIFWIVSVIPALALQFRRLHDTDRSAWWLLINLLPGIGGLVLLVFFLLDGTPGKNRFGPDPKGRGANAGEAAAAFS